MTVKAMAVIVLAALLGACSGVGGRSAPESGSLASPDAKKDQVHLELIRSMLDHGQYYAALAHIEDQRRTAGDSPPLQLMEADARRELDQFDRAQALYQGLLAGPLAGQAYHGLGLLYAERGDLADGIAALRQAAERLPTDAGVRNDLGYALMQDGQYRAAMPELATAAELEPDRVRSRKNLIMLMFLMGDPAAAQRLATQAGLGAGDLQKLRLRALQLADETARRRAQKQSQSTGGGS